MHPKQLLNDYLADIAKELGLSPQSTDLVVMAKPEQGDYATSVALQCAKEAQCSPFDLANKIADKLKEKNYVAEVEAVAPGFVNITLARQYWNEWMCDGAGSVATSLPANGKTVNLEFVSANPTGPLVLVNAWQAFYGDILGRIFTQQGYEVAREYYSNDSGSQIEHLGQSIQAACGEEFSEEQKAELYKGAYIEDLAAQLIETFGDASRIREQPAGEIGKKASQILFDQIKTTLKRIDVAYDRFFSEQELDLDAALQILDNHDIVSRKEGAVWLKKEVVNDDQDRVLIRSNNQGPTYFFKDIAYQLNRLQTRGFDQAITIVGADHHAESQYLARTLEYLGVKGFVPLTTQTVRLVKDGTEVKMSKRAGQYVTLEDFLNQVPVDVARFYFGSRDISSHLDIALDNLIAKSKSNPVYYTMYAYVRARRILDKAQAMDHKVGQVSHEFNSYERELAKQFAEIPTILSDIPHSYRINSLFFLLQSIAKTFHTYYEEDRILKISDEPLRASKLGFVAQFAEVLEYVYDLLGISVVDSM